MKIDKATLLKIAHLARLEIREEDTDKLTRDLSKILDWIDQLDEVNTDGVLPLTTMSHEVNAMRPDKNVPHLAREQALNNAPQHDGEHFKVPKVLK